MVGVEIVAWRATNGNTAAGFSLKSPAACPGQRVVLITEKLTVSYGHALHTPAGLGVSRLRTTQSDECVFPRVTITSADAIHVSR